VYIASDKEKEKEKHMDPSRYRIKGKCLCTIQYSVDRKRTRWEGEKKKEKKKDQGYQKAGKGRGKEEEGLRSHSKAKHGQQKVGGEVEQTRPSIKRAEMQWHRQNTAVLHGCKVTKPGQRIRPKHTLTNPPPVVRRGSLHKSGPGSQRLVTKQTRG